MTITTERRFPFVLAMCTACIYWIGPRGMGVAESIDEIIELTAQVSAICAGFMITAKSILITSSEKRVLRYLKEKKQYKPLMRYFQEAELMSLFVLIWSGLLLMMDLTDGSLWDNIGLSVWIFLVTFALAAVFRVVRLFNLINLANTKNEQS